MNRFKYLQGTERTQKYPANVWASISAGVGIDGVHIIEYGLPYKGITVIYRRHRQDPATYYVTLNASKISEDMESFEEACDWADKYIWEHGL
jgi:hypothetical protein